MDVIFWGSPSLDFKMTLIEIAVALVISIVILLLTRKKLLPVILFSVLGNIIFFLDILARSEYFAIHKIVWLQYFTVFVWPIINLVLIIILAVKYFKSKKDVI